MTRDDIICMAREAGFLQHQGALYTNHKFGDCFGELKRFAALVAAAEREACAKVAESLWRQHQDTKDAHERLSLEPFMPGHFGFDQSSVQQSRRIADAIRARSQA